jgi:hypothetical protein
MKSMSNKRWQFFMGNGQSFFQKRRFKRLDKPYSGHLLVFPTGDALCMQTFKKQK